MKKILFFFTLTLFLFQNFEVFSQTTVKKVVLQGFWWDYWNNNYPNSWANYLTELSPRLKSLGIDAVWIPPTVKNAGTNSVGYSPFDQYDLGDKYQKNSTTTRFGTKDDFLQMVAVMHANGIEVIQDVVLNHTTNAGAGNSEGGEDTAAWSNQWKNFRYVCYKTPVPYGIAENANEYLSREGRWPKNWQNFHPQPGHNTESGDWAEGLWGPDFCYGYSEDGTGNGYGQSSNAVYNPIQASGYNRDQARAWIIWLKKQTAVDGFRWDAVKHFPHFVVQDLSWNVKYGIPSWAQGGEAMYNVGEYVDFDRTGLDNYVNNVASSNGGSEKLIGTFDFDLRDALYGVITGNGDANLGAVVNEQQSDRVTYYSGSNTYVHRTAPFVNNHDTFRPQLDGDGNYNGWNTGSELAPHIDPFDGRLSVVYAIIFGVDGNPQVFFEDLFNIGNTSKRWTHDPKNTTELPIRDDIANIIWCHQNLDFKDGAYKVRWQADDALVIERSTKALIAVNDQWSTWQNLTGVQTDFADGTVLKDYSGANGTAEKTVYSGGKVDISIPPCDGSALQGRRGYSIWAPKGISSSYNPSRSNITTQEWEMADDLGDSDYRSLGQGGKTETNYTNQQLVGKIFAKAGSTVTYTLYPANSSLSLDINLHDIDGYFLSGTSGTGTLTNTYSPPADMWISLKVNNTTNSQAGQACWVRVSYTAPTTVITSNNKPENIAAIWTGRISNDETDPRNWECGVTPNSTRDLVIPKQNTKNNISITTSVNCKKLRIEQGINVSIDSSGSITCSSDVIADASSVLNLISGSQMTVNGNCTLNGTLNIESPSNTSIGGSLITNGNISGSGTVNVNRTFNVNNKWQFVSTPMNNQQSTIFTTNAINSSFNSNLYSYNEACGDIDPTNSNYSNWSNISDTWIKIQTSASNPVDLNIGQGYLTYNYGNLNTLFSSNNPSDLYTGDKIVNVSYTDNDDASGFGNYYDGWNLIGNPFPSAIDFSLLSKTASMDNTVYIWDSNSENYIYYTEGSSAVQGSGQTLNSNANAQYIPAMQSFMIHLTDASANDDGSVINENFTLSNLSRVHSSAAMFKSEDKAQFDFLKLEINGNNKKDQTLIRFIDESNADFDPKFDAFKMFSINKSVPMIYSLGTKNKFPLAINSLPELQNNDKIILGIQADEGNYKIVVDNLNSVSGKTFFLTDTKQKVKLDTKNLKFYKFHHAGGDIRDRFYISVEDSAQSSSDKITSGNDINIWTKNSEIYISPNKNINSYTLYVYDILGKKIYSKEVKTSNFSFNLNRKEEIIFIEIIQPKNKIITKKIYLQ